MLIPNLNPGTAHLHPGPKIPKEILELFDVMHQLNQRDFETENDEETDYAEEKSFEEGFYKIRTGTYTPSLIRRGFNKIFTVLVTLAISAFLGVGSLFTAVQLFGSEASIITETAIAATFLGGIFLGVLRTADRYANRRYNVKTERPI